MLIAVGIYSMTNDFDNYSILPLRRLKVVFPPGGNRGLRLT